MVFPFATFVVIGVENANPSKINIGSGARAIADCVEVLVSYGTFYSQRTHYLMRIQNGTNTRGLTARDILYSFALSICVNFPIPFNGKILPKPENFSSRYTQSEENILYEQRTI